MQILHDDTRRHMNAVDRAFDELDAIAKVTLLVVILAVGYAMGYYKAAREAADKYRMQNNEYRMMYDQRFDIENSIFDISSREASK